MHQHEIDTEDREAALIGLLSRHPDAIVAALDDRGFRVPLPESFPLDGHQALTCPDERVTMLDVIEPADRIAVVAAWERARRSGIGVVTVHGLGDPDTALTLSMVDVSAHHGVWLAVLARDGTPDGDAEALAGPTVVPSRPRQATMHKNMTALITDIDENVTKMLGWTREQIVGSRSSEFMHPEDQERAVAAWMQLLATTVCQRVRVRHRCADGGWLWVEIENLHNGAEDADEVDVVTNISDISDEMAAHEALRRREQLFSRLAEALPTGVLQLAQDGSVVYANARLSAILHTGTPASRADLVATIAPDDRPAVDHAVDVALSDGLDCELEVEVRPPRSAESRRCAVTIAAVDDQEGQPGALICVSDVTESVQMREQLRIQATHDALTGCLNRSAVMEALEDHLAGAEQGGTVAVFVDIDNFKPVNDRLGHAAGDEVLIHVARRLKGLCREHDLVARLGGDEFLLVCRVSESPAGAAALADRVRDVLGHPIALPSGVVELRASVGVAEARPGMPAETLISEADAAMYECKRQQNRVPHLHDVTAPARKAANG
jgi:diguanylate cyclase (GGDEF)-like protein/PAS domain S-box-containing protein